MWLADYPQKKQRKMSSFKLLGWSIISFLIWGFRSIYRYSSDGLILLSNLMLWNEFCWVGNRTWDCQTIAYPPAPTPRDAADTLHNGEVNFQFRSYRYHPQIWSRNQPFSSNDSAPFFFFFNLWWRDCISIKEFVLGQIVSQLYED